MINHIHAKAAPNECDACGSTNVFWRTHQGTQILVCSDCGHEHYK